MFFRMFSFLLIDLHFLILFIIIFPISSTSGPFPVKELKDSTLPTHVIESWKLKDRLDYYDRQTF
jgi:hypothetical protein